MIDKPKFVGRKLYDREGKEAAVVSAVMRCTLTGCSGLRLQVQWADGKRTRPCTKDTVERPDGALQLRG